MSDSKRFLSPTRGLRKVYLFLEHAERNTFFLDAAGANRFEAPSQAIRIHSRGGAYGLEVMVVVKKKMLRFAAKTERATDPFFQSFCDHGAPKPLFRRGSIVNRQKRTFKHADGLQFKFVFL